MCTPVLGAQVQKESGTATKVNYPRDHTHNKALSSLFANLIFVADCMRLHQKLEFQNDDEDKNTHYPRPSRPENALLINSSWSACANATATVSSSGPPRRISTTHDHGRALCADEDWVTLVGNHHLGSRVTVWRWHIWTRLSAGEPKLASPFA